MQIQVANIIPSFDSRFRRNYIQEMQAVSRMINYERPDLIVAMSRKGPRLIEFMRLINVWDCRIPVISEKAIDLMGNEHLKGKKILLFDDIIIKGSTVESTVKYWMTFTSNIKVVCLTIEGETTNFRVDGKCSPCLDKTSCTGFCVPFGSDTKIPINFGKINPKSERFVFCDEIVRGFTHLNKSFDIDFPQFYFQISRADFEHFLSKLPPGAKSFEITTEYQKFHGFRRYSLLFMPHSPQFMLLQKLLNFPITPQICKFRIYYNEIIETATFVPMVTFSVDKERVIQNTDLFSKASPEFNSFLGECRNRLTNPDEERKIMGFFRLFFYLLNFLWAHYFLMQYLPGLFTKKRLSRMLRLEDLHLIFGLELSNTILNWLDRPFNEKFDNLAHSEDDEAQGVTDNNSWDYLFPGESPLDDARTSLCVAIEHELSAEMKHQKTLVGAFAAIFQCMYYAFEANENSAPERLKVGFNLLQIKWILKRFGIITDSLVNIDCSLSLALDILVDRGIIIPIFYETNEAPNTFERVYRYGEGGIFAERFAYYVASTLQKFFDDNHITSIPRISFEKIGVLCFNRYATARGIFDLFNDPNALKLDTDRNIDFSIDHLIHGTVLKVHDLGTEDPSVFRGGVPLFEDWCKDINIIMDAASKSYSYNNSYLNTHQQHLQGFERLVPKEYLETTQDFLNLLYIIDTNIEKRCRIRSSKNPRSEILSAFASCASIDDFIPSILFHLRHYFLTTQNGFGFIVSHIPEKLDEGGIDTLTGFKESFKMVSGSAGQLHFKTKIRKKIGKYLAAIRGYYDSNSEYYGGNKKYYDLFREKVYNHTIEPFLRDIEDKWNGRTLLPRFHQINIRKISNFAEICYLLEEVTRLCIKSIVDISSKKKKNIVKSLSKSFTKMRGCLLGWNKLARTFGDRLQQFDEDQVKKETPPTGLLYYKQFLENNVGKIRANYKVLEEIYNNVKSSAENVIDDRDGRKVVEQGIKRAIELSKSCQRESDRTDVTPKVGAVVIKDGQIILEGYRGQITPGDHAEKIILEDLRNARNLDVTGALLITTLEPCNSQARSPRSRPCLEYIIELKIGHVIIGMLDPNPEISGKSMTILGSSIAVEMFPLPFQRQVQELNKDFIQNQLVKYLRSIQKKLPKPLSELEDRCFNQIENHFEEIIVFTILIGNDRFTDKDFLQLFIDMHVPFEAIKKQNRESRIFEFLCYIKEHQMWASLMVMFQRLFPGSASGMNRLLDQARSIWPG